MGSSTKGCGQANGGGSGDWAAGAVTSAGKPDHPGESAAAYLGRVEQNKGLLWRLGEPQATEGTLGSSQVLPRGLLIAGVPWAAAQPEQGPHSGART